MFENHWCDISRKNLVPVSGISDSRDASASKKSNSSQQKRVKSLQAQIIFTLGFYPSQSKSKIIAGVYLVFAGLSIASLKTPNFHHILEAI